MESEDEVKYFGTIPGPRRQLRDGKHREDEPGEERKMFKDGENVKPRPPSKTIRTKKPTFVKRLTAREKEKAAFEAGVVSEKARCSSVIETLNEENMALQAQVARMRTENDSLRSTTETDRAEMEARIAQRTFAVSEKTKDCAHIDSLYSALATDYAALKVQLTKLSEGKRLREERKAAARKPKRALEQSIAQNETETPEKIMKGVTDADKGSEGWYPSFLFK